MTGMSDWVSATGHLANPAVQGFKIGLYGGTVLNQSVLKAV